MIDREKVIQKCIAIAGLSARSCKIMIGQGSIREVAILEGRITKEIKELEELFYGTQSGQIPKD